jgi:uncharacterized protein with FMN-binding domain
MRGRARARRFRKESRAYAAAGAATVAAIYAVGYSVTQPATVPAKPTAPIHHGGPPAPTARPHRLTSRYSDGRFTGAGTSQFGEISVELTVTRGRVTSVEITRATTFFPASAVSPLIGEVVARQSAQLDVVSGATGSSQAFQGAVQQALSKARV